ncbi:DNA-binding protein [Pseudomonas putida]|nr:DNA-binding protein [Pseudomonas putida]
MTMQTTQSLPDDLISVHAAAEIVGVSVATLATWRSTGRYELDYFKDFRNVYYSRSECIAFRKAHTRRFSIKKAS